MKEVREVIERSFLPEEIFLPFLRERQILLHSIGRNGKSKGGLRIPSTVGSITSMERTPKKEIRRGGRGALIFGNPVDEPSMLPIIG